MPRMDTPDHVSEREMDRKRVRINGLLVVIEKGGWWGGVAK